MSLRRFLDHLATPPGFEQDNDHVRTLEHRQAISAVLGALNADEIKLIINKQITDAETQIKDLQLRSAKLHQSLASATEYDGPTRWQMREPEA